MTPIVVQLVAIVALLCAFAWSFVADQLRMRERRAIWEGADASTSRDARFDSWHRRRLRASQGFQQLTREAVVDANERQADRALWDADPEFAAALGIKCPPIDTGFLRQSAEAMRPGGVLVLEAGVKVTAVDLARLQDEWRAGAESRGRNNPRGQR